MNKKGQALVEYVLIIALISVVIIAIVNAFGGYLKDSMTKSSCSLIGEEYEKRIHIDRTTSSHSNFVSNSVNCNTNDIRSSRNS